MSNGYDRHDKMADNTSLFCGSGDVLTELNVCCRLVICTNYKEGNYFREGIILFYLFHSCMLIIIIQIVYY